MNSSLCNRSLLLFKDNVGGLLEAETTMRGMSPRGNLHDSRVGFYFDKISMG